MSRTLTVGIPTFNGSAYIAQAIDSILMQQCADVDVLVSDNASTDDTADIVHDYVKRYPTRVSMRRNVTNLGYDANLDAIFRSARGDYVHILGDDDFLMDDAVANVLRVVNAYPDTKVLVGQVRFLEIGSDTLVPGIQYSEAIRCDGDTFFQVTKWGTAAVSSLVILRQAWLAEDLTRYIGSQWIHVAAIVHALAGGANAYIMPKDLVTVRTGNPRWAVSNGNQLYLGMRHYEVLSEMPALGYQAATLRFFRDEWHRTKRKDLLTLRATGCRGNIPTYGATAGTSLLEMAQDLARADSAHSAAGQLRQLPDVLG